MKLRVGWLALALLIMAVPRVHASHTPPDTLLILSSLSLPAIALDPVTGDRHFAYTSNFILTHYWETPGGWQSESITDSASLNTTAGFQLRIAGDGHPVAAYVRKGTLVCAVRGPGGWERDTLDAGLTGTQFPIALDLHPSTGEPSIAWARRTTVSGEPSRIFYARRSSGTWTTQEVDTTSSAFLNVALGIDGTGKTHIAWTRPGGEGTPRIVLVAGSISSPGESFVAAPVDSEMFLFVSMAIDRTTDEPRIVYGARDANFAPWTRYAYRAPGGAWQRTTVEYADPSGNPPAPALALDPAGNPFISYTYVLPIEPGFVDPSESNEVTSCGGVASEDVVVFHRTGGAGGGPFAREFLSGHDAGRAGLAAIASSAVGQADILWRGRMGCPPWGLTTTRVTVAPTAGVGETGDRRLVWAISNPARAGDPQRVSLALAQGSEASVALHDLAGRRVAMLHEDALTAGRQDLRWQTPNVNPGLYWLTVRVNGARIGSRALVILK
ncbi:MAG TPA: hypothetical protein VJY35_00140 [Candidatus Eisenbacteria bacterium]|nr:hypothetical protein [Candidatus Eisenbacteria bacterium]